MKPTKKLSKKRVAPVKKNPPLLVQPLPLMKLIKLLTNIIRYRNNGYSKEERSELGLDLIEFGTETLLEIGEDLDALVLNRRHVDQQLAIHRLMTVCIKNTSDSTHQPASDHIHHAFGPIHHAGEQGHPQEHGTPGLAEVPVVGGVIQAGAQFRSPRQGVKHDRFRLERHDAGEAESSAVHFIRIVFAVGLPLLYGFLPFSQAGLMLLENRFPIPTMAVLRAAPRLMLHAVRLRFRHPLSGQLLTAQSPPPGLFGAD